MYRNVCVYRAAGAFALILAAAIGCNAQALPSPYRFSAIQTCISTQSPAVTCDIESYLQEAADSSLLTLNTTYAPSTAPVQMRVNNVADARYGYMRAAAEDTFQIGSLPLYTNSYSISEFLDVMTVNFPPFTGQTGYMNIQYTLNGSVSTTPGSTAAEGIFVCGVQAAGHNNTQARWISALAPTMASRPVRSMACLLFRMCSSLRTDSLSH